MTATVLAVVLTAVLGVAAIAMWRTGRRVFGTGLGLTAALPALVAVRDLPRPLIDALLIAGLLVIAGATVWPLLRPRPADQADRGRGGS